MKSNIHKIKCIIVITFVFTNYFSIAALPKLNINEPIREMQSSDTIGINLNSLNIELFGNSIYAYSINYERVFFPERFLKYSFSFGNSYFINRQPNYMELMFVSKLNCLLGKSIKHNIETGIGYNLIFSNKEYKNDNRFDYYYLVRLGYRYQQPNGRFLFKVAFSPYQLVSSGWYFDWEPWGGIAIGWTF
jgi:hypothetical protein